MREISNYIVIDNADGSADLIIDCPLFMEDQMNLQGRFDRNDLILTNGDGDQVCLRDVYRGEWMAAYYIAYIDPCTQMRSRTSIEI
jgi:hypothetical protein